MSELPLGLNTNVLTPWVGCQKAVRIPWVGLREGSLGLAFTDGLHKHKSMHLWELKQWKDILNCLKYSLVVLMEVAKQISLQVAHKDTLLRIHNQCFLLKH